MPRPKKDPKEGKKQDKGKKRKHGQPQMTWRCHGNTMYNPLYNIIIYTHGPLNIGQTPTGLAPRPGRGPAEPRAMWIYRPNTGRLPVEDLPIKPDDRPMPDRNPTRYPSQKFLLDATGPARVSVGVWPVSDGGLVAGPIHEGFVTDGGPKWPMSRPPPITTDATHPPGPGG